jgi:thiamine-phosphate pyrophosphorylase
LAQLVAVSSLPNVAIGGLKPDHINDVLASGADGMAVVSAICGQPDPRNAARAFETFKPEETS